MTEPTKTPDANDAITNLNKLLDKLVEASNQMAERLDEVTSAVNQMADLLHRLIIASGAGHEVSSKDDDDSGDDYGPN